MGLRKSKSYKAAKKRLDKIFSRYIRMQGVDRYGNVDCISCGKSIPAKEADCGHYFSRRFLATRWSNMNCHPQCRYCNRFEEGNKHGFSKAMRKMYNEEELDELERLAHSSEKYTRSELDEMAKDFNVYLKELEKDKGLKLWLK